VFALAGAPVRASSLRVSPLALGASLRVQDSIQEGASRFYAELLCLRRVVALCAGPRPVLFLLDEILQGTNSHDRGIGATALVRGLVARGAVGLITTHDLALTAMVDALAPRARNAHFEDELREGVMRFDYRLRDGVVQRSNALELMKSVGLELGGAS
jgi:DNA mismatch repair ATPase MutS